MGFCELTRKYQSYNKHWKRKESDICQYKFPIKTGNRFFYDSELVNWWTLNTGV